MCPPQKSHVYTQTIIIIIALLMYPETGRVGEEERGRGLSRVYTVCAYIYRVYLNISRRHSWYTRIGYYYIVFLLTASRFYARLCEFK